MTNPRIFIGLEEIAGNYMSLARGLRQLGMVCDLVLFYQHPFEYGHDDPIPLVSWIRQIGRVGGRRRLARLLLLPVNVALRSVVFLWAALRYDVFIFAFASSFFPGAFYLDYLLLRLLGKRIICRFHGDDVRPPFVSARSLTKDGTPIPPNSCLALTRRQKRKLRRIERYASILINTPPQGLFHEKAFINAFVLGRTFTPPSTTSPPMISPDSPNRRPVRILHCPSNPLVKGTVLIRNVIDELKLEGHEIEFIELSGVSNDRVHQELRRCDIVLDQLFADLPMGALPAEAAYWAKPSVVAGYYATTFQTEIPADLVPPVSFCDPAETKARLRQMILEPERRRDLGRRAQEFVMTEWSVRAVAARWRRVILDGAPAEWYCHPRSLTYIYGAGIAKQHIKANVRALVQLAGAGALCLDDKPELVQRFLDFASASDD